MPIDPAQTGQASPQFIVVEGPIGVGKTSLAKQLAKRFSAELILEDVEENPFLEQFYRSGRSVALPAQLFFLFQRTRQLELLNQSDLFSPIRIADFHVAKDQLFAELNLSHEEMQLYRQIQEKLDVDIPRPDLVIYLQASVDALMTRISQRAVPYERLIDRNYLEKVADSYARFFYDFDESPLLIINASSIDPARYDDDFETLFEQVQRISGGRHFFNPAANVAFA